MRVKFVEFVQNLLFDVQNLPLGAEDRGILILIFAAGHNLYLLS